MEFLDRWLGLVLLLTVVPLVWLIRWLSLSTERRDQRDQQEALARLERTERAQQQRQLPREWWDLDL